jgi:hypothetical protein
LVGTIGGSQTPIRPGATVPPHRQPSLLSSTLCAAVEPPTRYREIPIAFAAPSSPHYARVPSLDAFGSRPRCLPRRCDGPTSETLHKNRGIIAQLIEHQPHKRDTGAPSVVSTPLDTKLRDRLLADLAFALHSGELNYPRLQGEGFK